MFTKESDVILIVNDTKNFQLTYEQRVINYNGDDESYLLLRSFHTYAICSVTSGEECTCGYNLFTSLFQIILQSNIKDNSSTFSVKFV